MAADPKTTADARLEAALEQAGFRDPRPAYRLALKYLRDHDRGAFDAVAKHFEDTLIPAVAGGADPVAAWLDYGRLLAGRLGRGKLLEVDASGRARAASDDPSRDSLLLFLPDPTEAPALAIQHPANATPAQNAAFELLVLGRHTASAYD